MTLPDFRSRSFLKLLFPSAVFLWFCFQLFYPINTYLSAAIRTGLYPLFTPVLICAALHFKSARDRLEIRLLLVYCLWFWISRALCGDPALAEDTVAFLDLCLLIPFFAVGFVLDRDGRRLFLNWLSLALGGLYFVFGVLGIAAFVQRIYYVNPITYETIGISSSGGFQRLGILNMNCNAAAILFEMAFLLMLYQFFTCKRKLWRLPIALAGLVHLLAASVTFSRAALLSLALTLGFAAAALLLPRLRFSSRLLRGAALALVLVFVTAFSYKLCGWCGNALVRLSFSLYPAQTQSSPAPEAGSAAEAEGEIESAETLDLALDSRSSRWGEGLESISSGRTSIWLYAAQSVLKEPLTLLRGHRMKDVMTTFDTLVPDSYERAHPVHTHNSLLQILLSMGLPGFLLALFLLLRIVLRCLRCLFSTDPRLDVGLRLLASLPVGCLVYFMLEPWLLLSLGTAPLCYYLFSSLVLGSCRELTEA